MSKNHSVSIGYLRVLYDERVKKYVVDAPFGQGVGGSVSEALAELARTYPVEADRPIATVDHCVEQIAAWTPEEADKRMVHVFDVDEVDLLKGTSAEGFAAYGDKDLSRLWEALFTGGDLARRLFEGPRSVRLLRTGSDYAFCLRGDHGDLWFAAIDRPVDMKESLDLSEPLLLRAWTVRTLPADMREAVKAKMLLAQAPAPNGVRVVTIEEATRQAGEQIHREIRRQGVYFEATREVLELIAVTVAYMRKENLDLDEGSLPSVKFLAGLIMLESMGVVPGIMLSRPMTVLDEDSSISVGRPEVNSSSTPNLAN